MNKKMKMNVFYFSHVEDFANDNTYFVDEFSKVYAKMLSNGYSSLTTV